MTPDSIPALLMDGVSVEYSGIRAVSEVDLAVPAGCIVALLGANGAGKTTILRTISGLLKPVSGRIWFKGRRIDGEDAHRIARMGIVHVPEGRGIFPSLSVRANLRMAGYASATQADLIEEGIERFPALGRRLDQLAGSLSGGEQQMLALARAVLTRPDILLLDEISMGLAPMIVNSLFDEVKAMGEGGTTVLLVEQYVQAALALADYAYVLDKGRVVDVGESSDLLAEGMLMSYLGG